jgi:acyl-CoA synthetase (NDP forming)
MPKRKSAVPEKRHLLNEYDSKNLLSRYGIPMVAETVVETPAEAARAAEATGYPVVLKGLSDTIVHKTEQGLVHVGLNNADAVKRVVRSMRRRFGRRLTGFLVQPMLDAKREFMAGLFRDPQFGPVVMFGVGGVQAEVIADVALRLAPLSDTDIDMMLGDIRAQKLLGAFRGAAPVDQVQLRQIIGGLSKLALDLPDIIEVDLNPLMAGDDGTIQAVDAAVVKGPVKRKRNHPKIDPEHIRSLFYPQSIAFIGASSRIGKWGHTLVVNTISSGYEGDIFLVNPKGGEIAGRQVYRSIGDITARVDLAVVTIPAGPVLDLIPELQKKNIRNMLLITSGFGETGRDGKRIERQLVAAARRAGILILGPNTMGICNPHIQMYCIGSPTVLRPGTTTVIAQSGNMGIQLLSFAEQQNIGIRAFSGSGNEAMLTIEDYIDGMDRDPLTRTVMLYVESIKNGRRFFDSARRVGLRKPIVLLKGGRTRAGLQAAASHTGALATDSRLFDAACRQAGIVRVDQPMELLDLAAAFSSLPLPGGNRVAIMTLGGGWGVITADLCAEFGLTVPELAPDLVDRFDAMLPPFWSRSNPVDLVGERDFHLPLRVMEELLGWEGCDGVINLGIFGRRHIVKRFGKVVLKADPAYSGEFIDEVNRHMSRFEKTYMRHIVNLMQEFQKPVIGVSLMPDKKNKTVYQIRSKTYRGIFFPTPERAVKAFAKMFEYRRFVRQTS